LAQAARRVILARVGEPDPGDEMLAEIPTGDAASSPKR
jgi:hypothetical protein